jgi:hypothetical protein
VATRIRLIVAFMAALVALAGCSSAGDSSAEAPDAPADAGGAEEPATDRDTDDVTDDVTDRQVIREAALTLESDDPDATFDAIGEIAENAGGFVADADLRRVDGILQGTVTVRVPAERLDAVLAEIEAAGADVVSRQLGSQDVTAEYTDVAAQLRNLRAYETELLAFLSEARETGDPEQVLMVFDRIRGVRDEIERLQGRQQLLDDLVALATVRVSVGPTSALAASVAADQRELEPWSPGRQFDAAWDATVTAFRGLVNAAIWLVVTALPVLVMVLLPVAALIWIGRVVTRRVARRRPVPPPPPAPPVPQPTPSPAVPSPPDRRAEG